MANTYEKVLNVIGKEPRLRQDFEIQGLLPWLRKKSKIFSTLKTDYLKDIVRNCSVGKFKRDDVIIKQGEIGDCFYIILAGKISIFIINKDKDVGPGGSGEGEEKDAFATIGTLNRDGKLDRGKLGNFVTSLGSGFPFGEVALVSDDAVRTATIIAEEDTDLLVVDRALYNRAVRDVLAEEFEEKQIFIKTNELFSSWIAKYRKQLAMAMYKETFPYDSILVKQGDAVNNIYFIISGQVEIRCDTVMHNSQYPKLYKLLEDEREKLIKEKRQKRQQDVENIPPSLKKKESPVKTLKMCYLGKNESLGEVEVLMDMESYMTTAICTEKTEVLVLEMKHYERLFVKKHQRTIDAMRRRLEVKLNTRTSVLKEYDAIPLIKLLQIKLHMLHNPPTVADEKKKKKPETSVQIAEKLFFNHQGPLLDIEGPGSVFFMIRAREKSRLKLQAHQKERSNARQRKTNGHLHAIRLPQSLIMAAQMAGAEETETGYEPQFETPVTRSNTLTSNMVKPTTRATNEIDIVAKQNAPDEPEKATEKSENTPDNEKVDSEKNDKRPNSARTRFSEPLPDPLPRTFRRIQSAAKGNRSVDTDNRLSDSNTDDFRTTSFPYSRPRSEKFRSENNLHHLEAKVADWLRKDNPKASAHVSKLRRVQVEAEVEKMDMEELRSLVQRAITVQPILMIDIMRPPERQTDQGYHPEPGSSCPDWYVCGSCRQMPTLLERKASCISQLPTVDILIVNEGVLCLARMYRKDILVFEDDGD